jgi:F-type H+-transporting ATPase subunit b
MLIDWFTVGAQVLNFIILVWLMKRFLYQPILHAIDAREKKIADELAHADRISQEAIQAKAGFEQKNLAFEQQRDRLMANATEAANSESRRLLELARQTAEDLQIKQQQTLQNKMQELHHSIRVTVQQELFVMAKNALRDLAAVDIETQMVAVFVKRLCDMNSDQKSALQAVLQATPISVLSSNQLSPEQQGTIASTLKEILGNPDNPGKELPLQFDQSPDLIGGIELTANGFKIGWSVAEYLLTLEDALIEHVIKQSASLPT